MIKPGDQFGRWTVISNKFYLRKNLNIPAYKDNTRQAFYTCICACGSKKYVFETGLLRGSSKSCGCLRKELKISKDPWKTEFNIYKNHIFKLKPNLEFSINEYNFKSLSLNNCFYCGVEPNIKTKTGNQYKNGIDRLNNDIGYNLENCVSCCIECNFMKSSLNVDSFLNLVNNIYSYYFNNVNLTIDPEPLIIKKPTLVSDKIWETEHKRMKRDIESRNREFNVDINSFTKLVTARCYYCGAAPFKKTHVGKKFRNGIDRINNNLGYIDNNMIPSCWNCNKMKGKLNQDIFLNKIQKIIQKGIK
jgi:hypothetical protein